VEAGRKRRGRWNWLRGHGRSLRPKRGARQIEPGPERLLTPPWQTERALGSLSENGASWGSLFAPTLRAGRRLWWGPLPWVGFVYSGRVERCAWRAWRQSNTQPFPVDRQEPGTRHPSAVAAHAGHTDGTRTSPWIRWVAVECGPVRASGPTDYVGAPRGRCLGGAGLHCPSYQTNRCRARNPSPRI
jgi:hypothetical protein